MKNNPYVGPRPYERDDRRNFYGRDREAREVRALIVAEREVLFYAQSGAGKTSLLNALSLFIRPNLKILSIEDTPELRLPHMHWVPEVARSPLSVRGKTGEVTLFDLLKSSLRQRPDYIIVGEVRGVEAYVLFQQIATGHAALATIHAATLPQLMDRLTTPPINLPSSLFITWGMVVYSISSSGLRCGSKGPWARI